MCRLANVLSEAGVVAGDVVALYMPVSPLAVATMLATSRLGAVHNVVFAGLLLQNMREKSNNLKCKGSLPRLLLPE